MCSLKQPRSLPCPGRIPGHSLSRSATQVPPRAGRPCAVTSDDHNIKMAAIIKLIFTTEGPPSAPVRHQISGKSLSASWRFENKLTQRGDTAVAPLQAERLPIAPSATPARSDIAPLLESTGLSRLARSNRCTAVSYAPPYKWSHPLEETPSAEFGS